MKLDDGIVPYTIASWGDMRVRNDYPESLQNVRICPKDLARVKGFSHVSGQRKLPYCRHGGELIQHAVWPLLLAKSGGVCRKSLVAGIGIDNQRLFPTT
eukprot:scaffold10501_cov141-Amphora_coffeaeformis.AAC.15